MIFGPCFLHETRIFLGWKLGTQLLKRFLSFCKPSTTWLHVSVFGKCLIWILIGGLFTGKIERTTDNHKKFFIPKRCTCVSYLIHASDVEGETKKRHGRMNPMKCIMRILIVILMIHNESAASYKIKCGCKESSLENRVAPDKTSNFLCEANENLKTLRNTNDEGEVVRFHEDSSNSCFDSCATG